MFFQHLVAYQYGLSKKSFSFVTYTEKLHFERMHAVYQSAPQLCTQIYIYILQRMHKLKHPIIPFLPIPTYKIITNLVQIWVGLWPVRLGLFASAAASSYRRRCWWCWFPVVRPHMRSAAANSLSLSSLPPHSRGKLLSSTEVEAGPPRRRRSEGTVFPVTFGAALAATQQRSIRARSSLLLDSKVPQISLFFTWKRW